jgi:hypothetical protein
MPQIKPYTAGGQGGGGIPDAPVSIREADTGVQEFGKEISNLGQQLSGAAGIEAKLQNQKLESDFLLMRDQYETGVKATHQNLMENPDVLNNPDKYATMFTAEMTRLDKDIRDRFTESPALGMFNRYLVKQSGNDFTEARAVGRKLYVAQETEKLELNTEILAKRASEAATPAERQQTYDDFEEHLTNTVSRGVIRTVERDKRLRDFNVKVLENDMTSLRLKDRNMLRERYAKGDFREVNETKALEIMAGADADQTKEESKTVQVLKEAREFVQQYYWTLANKRGLSIAQEEEMLAGKNPYISAEEAKKFIDRNRNPPVLSDGTAARAIRTELALIKGSPRLSDVEAAKGKLRALRAAGDNSKDVDEVSDHLESLSIRLRDVQSKEDTVNLNYGLAVLDTYSKTVVGSPEMSAMQRGKEKVREAEFKKRFADSPDKSREFARDLAKELAEKKKAREDSRTPAQKAADELRKQGKP